MKKLLLLTLTLVCAAAVFTSCNKEEEDVDPVDIVATWTFIGCDSGSTSDISIMDHYLFQIDESSVVIYAMDRSTVTETLSYTRKGNKLTFSPKFNGKYETAKVSEIFGVGIDKKGISWNCGNGQIYNFTTNKDK